MAHSYIMSAGEELPVLHDFLGIVGPKSNSTGPKSGNFSCNRNADLTGCEAGFRSLPTNGVGRAECSSPSMNLSEQFYVTSHSISKNEHYKPDADGRHGKRRDPDGGRDAVQQLQRQPETLSSSPFLKVSRLERHGDMKGWHIDGDRDTPMQPPRMSLNCSNPLLNTSDQVNQDTMQNISSKWANFGSIFQNGHSSLMPDKAGLNVRVGFPLTPPPSDEGSRTGLKGSSVQNLVNCNQADKVAVLATPAQFGRSQSFSQSATGSESLLGRSQQMMPMTTSRQLTIFYGGQAHVFDDVTSDKVEAIMALAGANGRSWSTMYSPRAKTSLSHMGSEGSLQVFDKEREKSVGNGSSMSGFSALALSGATNGVVKVVASSNLEQEGNALALKHEEKRGMGPAVLQSSIEVRKEVQ